MYNLMETNHSTGGKKRYNLFVCQILSYILKMHSNIHCASSVASVVFKPVRPSGRQATRLLCPWDSPGKSTGVGCHALLQGIFLTQRLNPRLLHLLYWQAGSLPLLLLLLSHFSRVRLCMTPERAAHQAPPSLGFSRQEHWSGLPFPSPMHESEK